MENTFYNFTQNRELSWLKFNERVLDEARDDKVPLLERLKFLSIFTSNLDEFFMIRVGSLYDISLIKNSVIDNKSGMTPARQLEKIYRTVNALYYKKDETYEALKNILNSHEIFPLDINDTSEKELKYLKSYFKDQILPLLSPQIIDSLHPFPHLKNKVIHIGACLESGKRKLLGIIPIPEVLPEIVYLPDSCLRCINVEQIILEFTEMIFENYKLLEKTCFCVTRNADINLNEDFDENADFRHAMKKLLSKRKRLSVVRLEIESEMDEFMMDLFMEKFNITKEQIFITKSPMKLSYVFSFESRLTDSFRKMFCYPEFTPQIDPRIQMHGSIFKYAKKSDVLLFYPYESMELFLSLIKEAAYDSSVVSIKITIYRLAQKTKLVEYLCAAAENGKDVAVLIELRARFDEQNNIDWSERLEEAGCRILYGFDEFKVHTKICLITYKEKGSVRYITQVGTGNYNEKTALLYTDFSLITANQSIGEDAAVFFKNMAIGNLSGTYQHLLIAPNSLKSKLLELIEEEIDKGSEGHIIIKVNSVTDRNIIDALARASRSGVKVFLIVRGICCILPDIKNHTENITIISIVGRFLEHSRIYSFGTGASQKLYISSADIMTRNMERRVEAACPILDENSKNRINKIIDVLLADNVKARTLNSYGNYEKKTQRTVPVNSQEYFFSEFPSHSSPAVPHIKKENRFSLFINKLKLFHQKIKQGIIFR